MNRIKFKPLFASKKTLWMLLVFISTLLAKAQSESKLKKTLDQDLARTYGFCLGQSETIRQIKKKFPDLEAHIFAAEMEWRSTFGAAVESIKNRLKANAPQFSDIPQS